MKKNIKLFFYASIASLIYFSILFSGVLKGANLAIASFIVELVTIPLIILQLIAAFFAIKYLVTSKSKFSYAALSILFISLMILIGMILIP
ncbi:hypothetical protein SAMN04488524_1812 [Pedobacter africanus]|uniref:Uncharacterized protein n=1 Tax=Pedobacter africanus TaxID=151894 RepID=A0A1W2B0A0_9SPHI|nr:hypothetical protein SAMN04488524_1812 [Pedobacter africanus]